jgi:hypothetical protein
MAGSGLDCALTGAIGTSIGLPTKGGQTVLVGFQVVEYYQENFPPFTSMAQFVRIFAHDESTFVRKFA